jgi:flagellar protein FlaG
MNLSGITSLSKPVDPLVATGISSVKAPKPAVQPDHSTSIAEAKPVAAAPGDSSELDKALDAANRKLANEGHEIRFEYDREASKIIVRLVDTGTQEVLRQFPSNEALRMARMVHSGKPLLNTLA